MPTNNKIIAVAGPTATGKTDIAIELAKLHGAEVINFDSLVFYKELTIGTAKPTEDEMDGVPHHLVGTQAISEALNAAQFVELAIPIIIDCHKRNKLVILVGGSGFYLQALLNGMFESVTTPQELIQKSEELYQSEGIRPFIEELKVVDPESYERYHENDHYRIRRAIEHYWTTKTPLSKVRDDIDKSDHISNIDKYNWDVLQFYLDVPKDIHFEIITSRAQKMYDGGLVDEVDALLKQGHHQDLRPLQSIGYKETIQYLQGGFASKEDYLERLSINTRRLAKAQRTWFKSKKINCYNPLTEKDALFEDVSAFLDN